MNRHSIHSGKMMGALRQLGAAEWYITLFIAISVLASLIANDKALLKICDGNIYFPFIGEYSMPLTHDTHDSCFTVLAPVPYGPGKSDPLNSDFSGPFEEQNFYSAAGEIVEMPLRHRHWLGTNLRGSDLLADIIHGSRVSLLVSISGTFLSLLVGGLIGFSGGWYGPGRNKISLYWLLIITVLLFLFFFFINNLRGDADRVIGAVVISLLFFLAYLFSLRVKGNRIYKYKLSVSVDGVLQRFTGFASALPRLILILSFMQFFTPSFASVLLMLAATGWIDIARLLRAEIQRMKKEQYIEAAKGSGIVGFRLFTGQILPNIWPSLSIAILYSIASNITVEASLSFLGFGLPVDTVTLGGLIASGKMEFEAWWMVLFPGLWISFFVFSLFSLSRKVRSRTMC